ncbi:uncharacterized protein G2W53_033091 [Senna tora]|uniref:Uncharacterized protein n=1 Tax=Senna tora TaxID=362788 RepID=A0A834T036_9FABA|nr:uncharacterized protein G2W53_033091 [Senna tora]
MERYLALLHPRWPSGEERRWLDGLVASGCALAKDCSGENVRK